MSFSYDRYERQGRRQGYGSSGRRSTLGYWVPLALTVTAATVGLAAWIWSERHDDDDGDYNRDGGPDNSRPPHPPGYSGPRPGDPADNRGPGAPPAEDASMMARMSGALRRTPSPQQLFDGASRKVAAGVAAAGAVVGGALSSIREEDKGDFEDHSRWSEEAESRNNGRGIPEAATTRAAESITAAGTITAGAASTTRAPATASPRQGATRKKTIAIVISSESSHGSSSQEDVDYHQEHAVSCLTGSHSTETKNFLQTILSHLPEHIDPANTRLFVVIYAPDLKQHPLASSRSERPTGSLTSSYSNIGHEDLQTPGEEAEKRLSSPKHYTSSSPLFNLLYSQAQALVEKETMILPFTTPTGHVHLLRHLSPDIVYIQEKLSGTDGDAVMHISSWVGQTVLVVGDEGGHGGLVDSEDDMAHSGDEKRDTWWEKDSRIGLGKGIEVVEGLRMREDWRRRAEGQD